MTGTTNLREAVGAAGLAELVWASGDGRPPAALGAVPLLLAEQPAVALPWAYREAARAAAAASSASLMLSEPRLAGPRWQPLVATGRLTLVEDGDGDLFTSQLLDQELRKHPPARLLADSPLLRRENWWYLPRLVLLLEPEEVSTVRPRSGPDDAVLAVDVDGLRTTTVRVQDWEAPLLRLEGAPPDADGPAALVGQEVSVPDAERWTVHVTPGRYAHGTLEPEGPPPGRHLEPVPGLRARVRRQRALERACVEALRSAGHG